MISKEQLEKSLSAEKFPDHIDNLFKHVQKQRGGKEAIRLRKHLVKNLVEEGLPISCFVKRYYGKEPNVFVQMKVGNQNYDAIIDDRRVKPDCINFIEVTLTTVVSAKNGYEDYLLRYFLNQHGHSGTGKVRNLGSKNRGMRVELDRQCVSQDEVVEHERMTVEAAIKRKLKSTDHYPENSALVISFDDTYTFDRADNQQNLKDVLVAFAEELKGHNFNLVGIVGINKGLYIEHVVREKI